MWTYCRKQTKGRTERTHPGQDASYFRVNLREVAALYSGGPHYLALIL
jgi:hypothetical protein